MTTLSPDMEVIRASMQKKVEEILDKSGKQTKDVAQGMHLKSNFLSMIATGKTKLPLQHAGTLVMETNASVDDAVELFALTMQASLPDVWPALQPYMATTAHEYHFLEACRRHPHAMAKSVSPYTAETRPDKDGVVAFLKTRFPGKNWDAAPEERLRNHIRACMENNGKTEKMVQLEVFGTDTSAFNQMLNGKAKVPLARIKALSEAIGADPLHLFHLAIKAYYLQNWAVLNDCLVSNQWESKLLALYRKGPAA